MNEKISLKGLLGNYIGLPGSIYTLFIAQIINRFGGFVHPFLVLFMGKYLHMSESQIGSMIFFAGAAGFLGSLIGGSLGDRFSRKVVYLTAQSIAAVLFIPCAFLINGNMSYIPWLLILSSFFSAVVRPVNTAMVTDLVEKKDRKRAFSLLYLGINVGVAAGPFVAAYLYEHYLMWLFLGDAITTFVAVALVAVFVKEHKLSVDEMIKVDEKDSEAMEKGNVLLAFIKRPVLIVFVLFSVITSMMYAQVGFAFPLILQEKFSNGPSFYAQLTAFNAIVVLAFTALIHYVTQQIRPIYNIAMAAMFYALGMGMMAFIGSKSLFVVSVFIWTLGEIQAVTNQNVYLMSHTPINYRSRFMGIISLITSAGYIVSPKIGGILIEKYGQSLLWTVVFIGGMIAATAFVVIGLYEKQQSRLKSDGPLSTAQE